MSQHTITVVDDYDTRPYGRYPSESSSSGERFRNEFLDPALKEYDFVTVDLTGYNRYGRSFIDETFGGLIRELGWTENTLKNKLSISHNDVESLADLAWERISSAQKEKNRYA